MASAVDFRLYLVTDRHRTGGRPLLDVVERALRGGVDAVQLREKDLPGGELFALAQQLRTLCRRHGARLLINDRLDVAVAVGADGVHLPATSFAPADARALIGADAFIGVSTHGVAEAHTAVAGSADFVVFGPLFDTPSKRAFGPPVGLDALARVADGLTRPVFAIGGITADRVASVLQRGARGVAVIAAVLEAHDPEAAAAELRSALDKYRD